MLHNFFISAIRAIYRGRVYSLINILGLAASYTTVFFIVQYVHFERSFDDYHSKSGRIFRVGMELQYESSSTLSVGSFYGMGEQAGFELAEIEDYFTLTFDNAPQGFLSYKTESGLENLRLSGSHYASSSILKILDFEFLEGNAQSGLTGTTRVVITRSLAQKIFGSEPAMGRTLTWFDTSLGGAISGRELQVGAVIEDLPANSNFNFEMLFPLKIFEENYPEYRENLWNWYGYYNYYQLHKPGDATQLSQKFPEFVQKHIDSGGKKSYRTSIFLEPIEDIRLESDGLYQMEEGGDGRAMSILIMICILLVILAYTNYTNLSTSINLERIKEVSIRRVLGSNRRQIISQFLIQALLINVMALVLSIASVFALSSLVINWIDGYPQMYLLEDPVFWLKSVALVLSLALVTGVYPAILVGRFKNTDTLKARFSHSTKGRWVHKAMVIFQFAIASVLLLFSFVINKQLRFMFTQDLGINMDQVVVAKAPLVRSGSFSEAIRVFQNQAKNIPGITAVSASTMVPGIPMWGNSVRLKGRNDEPQVIRRMEVDDQYLSVFEHEVVAGRGFSEVFQGDETKAMVNEQLTQLFGMTSEEMIGQTLFLNDTVEIVGVIKDYHHNSVKSEVLPMVLTKTDEDIYYVSARIQGRELSNSLQALEEAWQAVFPGSPFDTFFADERFESLYLKDKKFSRIISAFTATALFIACLGLFGISLNAVVRRRKEISVRKVLGAPGLNIFWTFSREIFALILIAGVLSIPLSYFLSENWLSGFANRIGLEVWMAFAPILFTLIFALAAIAYNVRRAIKMNPADTLRQD